MDRWNSAQISCSGGLIVNIDALAQGQQFPGSARILQNFEPGIEGGYRRISGYTKFDSSAVPGTTNNPVLGIKAFLGGTVAVRKLVNDNAIYFSSGSGWGSKLNSGARAGSVTKARLISYAMTKPVVLLCDGVNAAWKWDGTTETTINGAGSPTNPKYAAFFAQSLVLAGYGDGQKISITAPNDDTDFAGASGAAEINVGDVVKGLKTFRGTLYILCQSSIHALSGTSSANFSLETIATSIGCVSQDTIQELGGDVIWLANDGFRSLAATLRIGDVDLGLLSKAIQPIVRDIVVANLTEDEFSSCIIRKKSQYRCFVNNPSIEEAGSTGFIGKYVDRNLIGLQYDWSTTYGIKPYCADSEYTNNQEIAVLGHPTNGYVYKQETGINFDGRAIPFVYRSPDIPFDDVNIRKVFQKLTVNTQVEGTFECILNLILDKQSSNIVQPQSITLSQSGTVSLFDVAIFDTDLFSEFTFPTFYKNLIGSGFTGAFQFSGNAECASFRIDSFAATIATKGRR